MLDPLADKIFVTAVTLSLLQAKLLPVYVAFTLLIRDFGLISGTAFMLYKFLPSQMTVTKFLKAPTSIFEISPSLISKANTVLQLLLLWFTLGRAAYEVHNAAGVDFLQYLQAATVVTTCISGVDYAWNARRAVRSRKI
jgi:cardiolipin synthase